jgi:Amt family ammonium transporter
MTIPGLALFYGGLVRQKNVLSILLQCVIITALMTVQWTLFGYSMSFSSTGMMVSAFAAAKATLGA